MDNFIKSIQKCLVDKNYYAALNLCLMIPDICGYLNNQDSKIESRYTKFFNDYLSQTYSGYMTAKDCYALRCSIIHQASADTLTQRSKDILDYVYFLAGENTSHKILIDRCYSGDQKHEGGTILVLNTFKFCNDMIEAYETWSSKKVGKILPRVLEIKESLEEIKGFSIN